MRLTFIQKMLYMTNVGLNEWAKRFVGQPSVKKEVIVSGVLISGFITPVDDTIRISWSKYTFPDGGVYFEKTQSGEWDPPLKILALQDDRGNWVSESLWSKKAIEDELAKVFKK